MNDGRSETRRTAVITFVLYRKHHRIDIRIHIPSSHRITAARVEHTHGRETCNPTMHVAQARSVDT
jgi:hypothetical protein